MKKNFFVKSLTITLALGTILSSGMTTYANFGPYYSYRLFENENWHMYFSNRFQSCPESLIRSIELDDVGRLTDELSHLSSNGSNLFITSGDIRGTDAYNCMLCFGEGSSFDFGERLSLVDYALARGAVSCFEYLQANGVNSYRTNSDLVAYATISGNVDLFHRVRQICPVTINSLYVAMRMAFSGDIQSRASIIREIVESGVLENNLESDQIEKAIAFLLLAEKNCNDRATIETSLRRYGINNIVDQLISLCCRGGFSHYLAATIIEAPESSLPLYSDLKLRFQTYLSNLNLEGENRSRDLEKALVASNVPYEKLRNFFSGYQLASTDLGENLIRAAQSGNRELVEDLLNSGVDVDYRDRFGYTALGYAAMNGNGDIEMARLLLGAGADPNIPGKEIYTPLVFARTNNNNAMIELLTSYGAVQ